VLAACTVGPVPPVPSTDVVNVPAAVDATCATYVTAHLQAAIDRAEQDKTLRLTPGACYRAEQPLTIEHADGFTLEGTGAVIRRTESGPDDGSARTRMHFVVKNSRNVVIRDLTLIGPHPTSGRRYVAAYEAQHGFWLDGDVAGFWLVDSTIRSIWGDFVYLSGRPPAIPTGVSVLGNRLELNGRQGVAAVSGRNLVVARNEFVRVARSVLDLEPLSEAGLIDNVVLADNRIVDSVRFVSAFGAAAPVTNVRVLRNQLQGTPMIIGVISPGWSNSAAPSWRKHVVIDGNTSDTLPEGGHIVWIMGVEDLQLTNNRWRILDRPGAANPELTNNAPQVVQGNTVIVG
jgi:hypothetical protein